jgi:hypothetical protein
VLQLSKADHEVRLSALQPSALHVLFSSAAEETQGDVVKWVLRAVGFAVAYAVVMVVVSAGLHLISRWNDRKWGR